MSVKLAPYIGGQLAKYVGSWDADKTEWRDNVPFAATLRLIDYERGRSAVHFTWADARGTRYPMFAKDFVHVVKTRAITCGRIDAVWHVVKRGQNYGIALYGGEK